MPLVLFAVSDLSKAFFRARGHCCVGGFKGRVYALILKRTFCACES